jgi:2-methylcitrate dehydratase PrpD
MTSTLPSTLAATIDDVTRFAYDLGDDDVPDATRAHVGLLLLDTLGVAAAATGLPAGVAARGAAVTMFGTERAGAARLVFDGRAVSTAGVVFALAAQIDNLDAHDGYTPSKGHIGVVVVPALVAHAQAHPELTFTDAITALTVGYEVAGRAGLALHATVPEYHTSGAWNALGAAALAARLDGLPRPLLRGGTLRRLDRFRRPSASAS